MQIHKASVQGVFVNRIQINLFNDNAFARLASQYNSLVWMMQERRDLCVVLMTLTDVFYKEHNTGPFSEACTKTVFDKCKIHTSFCKSRSTFQFIVLDVWCCCTQINDLKVHLRRLVLFERVCGGVKATVQRMKDYKDFFFLSKCFTFVINRKWW